MAGHWYRKTIKDNSRHHDGMLKIILNEHLGSLEETKRIHRMVQRTEKEKQEAVYITKHNRNCGVPDLHEPKYRT